MRPLRLSFSGMRSYTGACGPLDFTGRNLIGILGDTGAGKSTILEAITFALFGSPSWSGSAVAPLVADGATAMTVDFTFAHDRQRWRVRRTFHTGSTPASHLLENLDTGKQFDNAGLVNRKIGSLLNLSLKSFQATVLPPQGRFDELLKASGRERTLMLKDIFGVQSIETMRERTTAHRERLTDLLNAARLARQELLRDPAATAANTKQAAEQAERRSARLTETLKALRAAQREAVRTRNRREELAGALAELDRRRVGKAAETIAEVRPVEQRLAEQAETLDTRKQTARERLGETQTRLAAAKARGATPNALSSAETVLAGAPGRLRHLADEREALLQEDRRLAEQQDRIATTAAKLAATRTAATELDAKSAAAAKTRTLAREFVRRLRDRSGTALGEALTLARSHHEEQAAEQNLMSRRAALPELRDAVDQAASALAAAEDRVQTVQRREAAHLAGTQLSAGESCPVCVRPVPVDYHAPDALDPQTLQAVRTDRETKAGEHQRAMRALHRADAELTAAEAASAQRRQATRATQTRLDEARARVGKAAFDPPWSPSETLAWDRDAFTAALDAAITTLSGDDSAAGEHRRTATLSALLEPAEECERTLERAAESARAAAGTARSEADGLQKSLCELRKSWEEATERGARAKRRHAAAEERLRTDLAALPTVVLEYLPADRSLLTEPDVAAARRAVAERQEHLNALVAARDGANADLAEIAERQRLLGQRHLAEVADPLRSLMAGLDRWAEAVHDAARRIGRNNVRPAVPAETTSQTAARYADLVARSAEDVRAAVRELLDDISTRTDELIAQLVQRTRDLGDHESEVGSRTAVLAVAVPADTDPLDAAFLDPLGETATTARQEAARLRAEQAQAESQIERARTLDAAIEAGTARHAAVEKLRGLLAEAKFQQYLIDQRTRALLGLASDLFGELSDGQFGFAEDFHIVSRDSGASRSPKTLSGGETFLASLALALALVELYSRSGARLGALFLDEGFGSLDVDTLGRALAVLRSETGGDKLVTVISHLRAVAEAVEDVLWVERPPTGSVVRWLSTQERDALVREEISAGLLSLA